MRTLAPAVLLALVCAGCTCSPAQTSPDGGPSVDAGAAADVWTAWRELSTQLKTSPDHLPARAEAVVATRDAVKIFEFVRDQILTYPPSDNGFDRAVFAQRWGLKGTLRGGAGTPREKAELLVWLYTRAGFTAEVVAGRADPAKLDGQKMLLRTLERPFALGETPAQVARWRAALGGAPRQYTAIDPSGAEATALASSLKALLPTTLTSPFSFAVTDIPFVKVTVAGEEKYANPLAPGLAFGDSAITGAVRDGSSPDAPPTMRVLLEAARSDAPYRRFELLDSTFAMADVVGRRIQLGFPPPMTTEQLLGARLKDVQAVVPVMAVVGDDLTAEDRARLVSAGDVLTFSGDVWALGADGGVLRNQQPVELDTDPAALARVASVQVAASPAAFPRVRLEVGALDAAGRSVPRLGSKAFTVEEGGAQLPFVLERNQLRPRVVLLADVSNSIPAEFRGAAAVAMGEQLVDRLYADTPDAELRVGVVNFGVDWATGTWAATQAEARTQVQSLSTAFGTSDLWEALGEAQRQKPTVIILLTDGDASDMPTPEILSAMGAGAPVLSIGVGPVKQDVLDRFSALTGGRSVTATLASQAVDAATAEIAARRQNSYALTYQAPAMGPSMRSVKVTVNGKSASASYVVPPSPTLPAALSGLYLTLVVDGRSYTRPLAGFSLGFSTAFPVLTQAMLDEVKGQLLGGVTLSVEAAAPSPSLILQEWVDGRLQLEPLVKALEARDDAAVKDFFRKGLSLSPTRLPLAHPPLRNANTATSLTFETGPRVAAMATRLVGPQGVPLTRELDLFALSRWATAAADGRLAWEKTLEATAGLAVMEKHLLGGTSTLEALEGKAVKALAPFGVVDQPGLTGLERQQWGVRTEGFSTEYTLIAPLKPDAFWAVHEATGTVMGILPRGTGGGSEACGAYDDANRAVQALGLLGSLFGASVGPWVALAQWEVKYITIATIVIGGGDLGMAGDINNPAIDMACGLANDALGSAIPAYGVFDTVTGTWSAINPDHAAPSACGAITPPGPCR